MSVVGTLAVKITGDNSGLDKSLKKSNADISAFAKKSALALVAAAGTFATFTKKTIDSFDRLAKLSVQAGVTTESLSALGYAAELSGVNTNTLATNLGRLSKGMLDAANGTGEAKKAFDTLGIDGGTLKDADEALMQIADKFQQLPDGAQKTALAIQLFGRSGMQMIPFLNQGRDGLEQIRQEAERFGIVVSTDASKAAEQFNDNLSRIGAVSKGFFYSVANLILPPINSYIDAVFEAERATGSWFRSMAIAQMGGLPATFDEFTTEIIKLETEIANTKKSLQDLKDGAPVDLFGEPMRDLGMLEDRLKMLKAVAEIEQKRRSQLTNVSAPNFTMPSMPDFSEKTKDDLDKSEKEYRDYLTNINESTKKEISDAEQQISEFAVSAARNIQGVLGDGIFNMLSGKFDDIGQSFLNMLNRMVADLLSSQMAQLLFGNFGTTNQIGGIVGQIAGAIGTAIGGGFSSQPGLAGATMGGTGTTAGGAGAIAYPVSLASGGYTGNGGQFEPAGIVHRGEYVLNAAATRRIGLDRLERMNKGFANGGYAGGTMGGGGVNINIKNEAGADGYKATAQAKTNSDGGLNIDVLVRRAVSADIQNNGALAQQMANTFGLRRSI